ncbi:hypothetical protein [Paenibacillus sp.]|uniref:hypothetical protein n=1 Tax=Paenibacillus sp. TaxID=58172 RepID=UPI0039C9136F
MKNWNAYEIMNPEALGMARFMIVFGSRRQRTTRFAIPKYHTKIVGAEPQWTLP